MGKSDALAGGKKSATFNATEDVYYIYVYRGQGGHQKAGEFFVRAFYHYEHFHGITVAENDGELFFDEKVGLRGGSESTLRWGKLIEDKGPTQL